MMDTPFKDTCYDNVPTGLPSGKSATMKHPIPGNVARTGGLLPEVCLDNTINPAMPADRDVSQTSFKWGTPD